MNKPGFRRPRRAAKPSTTAVAAEAIVPAEVVHVETAPVVEERKDELGESVDTFIKEEIELNAPEEASQTKEPEPLLETLVEPAVEATIPSSIPADSGAIASQPILATSPNITKHMAQYEHAPHSGTDHKHQGAPQNQMPQLAAPLSHVIYEPAPFSKPSSPFEENGFLNALDYLRDNIMEVSAEN